jgi:hypothetical protein
MANPVNNNPVNSNPGNNAVAVVALGSTSDLHFFM